MNGLLQIAASNTLVAALAAVVVVALTRVWRNPHLGHLLWALVLLKLVTPPLLSVPIPVLAAPALPQQSAGPATDAQAAAAMPAAEFAAGDPADSGALLVAADGPSRSENPVATENPAASARPIASDTPVAFDTPVAAAQPTGVPAEGGRGAAANLPAENRPGSGWQVALILVVVGGAGSAIWVGLLAVRVLRFNRRVRRMPLAAQAWQDEVAAMAARVELRAWPGVRLAEGAISPLLWTIGGRPVIVLPRELVERLDGDGRRALLAHELAHFYRRDHWMRSFEMLVLAVYWWNPVAHWARRRLRAAEEACCDAWAIWLLDGNAPCYGLALLETIEFLADARAVSPIVASGMGQSGNLKGRFEMILQSPFGRRPTWRTRLAAAMVALTILPFSLTAVRVGAQGEAEKSAEDIKAEIEKAAEALRAAIPASKRPPAPWLQRSPFTAVHVKDDAAEVEFEGKSHQLISIDGLSTKELLDGAGKHYGNHLREKRFVEDLVDLMQQMGHKPGETVKLVLRDPTSGETKTVDRAPMTAANRRQVYVERNKIAVGLASLFFRSWARLSPFTAVRAHGDTADVEFDGKPYQLVSIDDLPTKELLDGARQHFGDLWEKRFVEDLVEVMDRLGHRPGDTVKLVLRDATSGEIRTVDQAPMTAENRAKAYAAHYAIGAADEKQIQQLVGSFAAAAEKADLDALAKTLRPHRSGEARDLNYFRGASKGLAAGSQTGVVRSITPLPNNHALAVTDFFALSEPGSAKTKCVVYRCQRREGEWLIDDIEVCDGARLADVLRDAPRKALTGAVD